MIPRRVRSCLVGVVYAAAFVLLSVAPDGAQAAGAAPAWEIAQATLPTNLVPGTTASGETLDDTLEAVPRWVLFVTNVGAKAAGPATLTDTLPSGITVPAGAKPLVSMPNA